MTWLLYFPPPVLFITSRAKKKKKKSTWKRVNSLFCYSWIPSGGTGIASQEFHSPYQSAIVKLYHVLHLSSLRKKKKNHRKRWRETTTSAAHGTAPSPCSPGGEAGCRRGRGCKRVAGIRDAELTRHVKGTDGDETFGKVRQLTSDWFTPSPSTLFIYVADGRHKFHCGSQRYKPNSISQPVC